MSIKKSHILLVALFFLLPACFMSCYRMPGEDEYSVVPSTNHPDLIREKPGSILPTASY